MTPPPDGAAPTVSVIIAAWNAAATLERAVRSALEQTGVSVEVIVIDDASDDATLAVARGLAGGDDRVQVIAAPVNAGPAAARNRGLDAARGRFATPLDSDDFMAPDRLARLVALAEAGAWDFVADDLYKVHQSDLDGPRTRLWSQKDIGVLTLSFRDFVAGNVSDDHDDRGELGFIKPLMSMEFMRQHNLRYAEDMRLGEDYALYAQALLLGARFCLSDPAGYVAVERENSLSGQHSARDLAALAGADEILLRQAALSKAERAMVRRHYIDTLKRWHWLRLIDAVKARDLRAAAGCFAAPLPVVGALIGYLSEQVVLRGKRKIFGARAGDGAKEG